MSLTDKDITAQNFKLFYESIRPYLNGAVHAGFTPIGSIIAVMGNSAPVNYLACNGQLVNIVDYPELATYFQQQFGANNYFGGDGTTTFAVPDLRGEFLRGTGTNSHTNQGSGANVGVHQDATGIPYFYTFESGGKYGIQLNTNSFSNNDKSSGSSTNAVYNPPSAIWQGTATNPGAVYTRPTNTSVLYCIATKNIYLNPSLDYSTSEKVVGTWIDGKPLYQKTFSGTWVMAGDASDSVGTISNLDNFIDYIGYGFVTNYPNELRALDGFLGFCYANKSTGTISIKNGSAGITWKAVTLRYTKTTD